MDGSPPLCEQGQSASRRGGDSQRQHAVPKAQEALGEQEHRFESFRAIRKLKRRLVTKDRRQRGGAHNGLPQARPENYFGPTARCGHSTLQPSTQDPGAAYSVAPVCRQAPKRGPTKAMSTLRGPAPGGARHEQRSMLGPLVCLQGGTEHAARRPVVAAMEASPICA